MTHVFVAPHPDDVALSCGGLIASLRELGQNVTIVTVFSGDGVVGSPDRRTSARRSASARRRSGRRPRRSTAADIAADWPTAALVPAWAADRRPARGDPGRRRRGRQALLAALVVVSPGEHPQRVAGRPAGRSTTLPTQGAVYTDEIVDAAAAGDLMARRRLEDERFAYFAEASIVFLDLPDAVFRGYEGDDELLGMPRADDDAPFEILRREIARLEPQKVYFPLGRRRPRRPPALPRGRRPAAPGGPALGDARARTTPGIVTFYEDFPYAWWNDFKRPRRPAGATRSRASPPT